MAYIKRCPTCNQSYLCSYTYDPEVCDTNKCSTPLEEDIQATKDMHDQNHYEFMQTAMGKDVRCGVTHVRKIKTIGQQADANRRVNGRAWAEDMQRNNKTKRTPGGGGAKREMELPEGAERKEMTPTKMNRDLLEATPAEIQKYVMEGQMPIPKADKTKELRRIKKEKIKENKRNRGL